MFLENKAMIEAKTMAQIVKMSSEDNKKLLERLRYGHLVCTRDMQPYVVPFHYAYQDPHVYIFSTE
jgi:nitroimidazol reductase NimA-like FMN-containing flavoprotein (pyridoxamine 5'-phosphate oxidase superfamily)